MTKTAAVMIAPGCEEVEALSSVDVLRRAGIKCDMVGLFDKIVNGDHDIILTCDKVMDESLLDYDIVIFPGGLPGSEALRDNETLRQLKKLVSGMRRCVLLRSLLHAMAYWMIANIRYIQEWKLGSQMKSSMVILMKL